MSKYIAETTTRISLSYTICKKLGIFNPVRIVAVFNTVSAFVR